MSSAPARNPAARMARAGLAAEGTVTGAMLLPRPQIAIGNIGERRHRPSGRYEQTTDDVVDVLLLPVHLRQQAGLRVCNRRHVEDRRLPLEAFASGDAVE